MTASEHGMNYIDMNSSLDSARRLTMGHTELTSLFDDFLILSGMRDESMSLLDFGPRRAYNYSRSWDLLIAETMSGREAVIHFPGSGVNAATLFRFAPHCGKPWVLILPALMDANMTVFDSSGIPIAAELTSLGYNAAVLEYSSGPSNGEAQLDEVSAAVQLLAADSDIVLMGFSTGGQLALMWTLDNKEQRHCPRRTICASSPLLGAGGAPCMTACFERNLSKEPLKGCPPIYLIHGALDTVVSPKHSEIMAHTLREAQVSCQYVLVSDGGHNFGKGFKTEADGWLMDAMHFGTEGAEEI